MATVLKYAEVLGVDVTKITVGAGAPPERREVEIDKEIEKMKVELLSLYEKLVKYQERVRVV